MNAPAATPAVSPHRCNGCGRCVSACSSRLLSMEVHGRKKRASLNHRERCVNCLNCFRSCTLRDAASDDFF